MDEIDHSLIGWEDPYSSYDSHNIIFDVPKVAEEKRAQRKLHQDDAFASDVKEQQDSVGIELLVVPSKDSRQEVRVDDSAIRQVPIFSIVKSWEPVEASQKNNSFSPSILTGEKSVTLLQQSSSSVE